MQMRQLALSALIISILSESADALNAQMNKKSAPKQQAKHFMKKAIPFRKHPVKLDGGNRYYIRGVNQDGNMAWSSPT